MREDATPWASSAALAAAAGTRAAAAPRTLQSSMTHRMCQRRSLLSKSRPEAHLTRHQVAKGHVNALQMSYLLRKLRRSTSGFCSCGHHMQRWGGSQCACPCILPHKTLA